MKQNVGKVDRWIRIVVGVLVLSLLVFVSGPARWFGLLGLIPLITGLFGFCPLYWLFHLNTNNEE